MTEDELRAEGFVPVCDVAEVGGPLPKLVSVEGHNVLLCYDDGSYFAVDEICPHENQSMKFGVVFGGEITCPHHQYRFKLDSGRSNRRCAPLETYDVHVLDDRIWVRVDGRGES